ncbi:mannose/glucose-specific lectin isoform X3 [Lactuca sativa]|uniref:mannose/glucose-specific lectin isoform X3 n=1 Tax=Lactuca sativa TaxID=4236 RepID=UPI000CD93A40|nr:mannose/glucose-specific lectin isoform X3 [Lactuca sativa]
MQQPVSSGGEVGSRASSYLQASPDGEQHGRLPKAHVSKWPKFLEYMILCCFLMEKEQYLKMPLKRIILAVMLYVPFCMASLGVSKVGLWGTKSNEDPQNRWDFLLEKDHKLRYITVDHDDLIYSLVFTTKSKGFQYTAHMVGGWNGGVRISKVVFEDDEEIIGIDGTVGVSTGEYDGYTIISSLSFVTNKKTHGPFGRKTHTPFTVPWVRGSFGGFYGLAGYYIDAIGVYITTSSDKIARVGIWGTKSPGGPQNKWSFQLERNHRLKKITIDHGDLIYSLMFTTKFKGVEKTSNKAGGWNGGDIVSEILRKLEEGECAGSFGRRLDLKSSGEFVLDSCGGDSRSRLVDCLKAQKC